VVINVVNARHGIAERSSRSLRDAMQCT